MDYKQKYLKYKEKYLRLKKQLGGNLITLHSLKPDITFEPIDMDYDAGDDINTLKQQIVNQIGKPDEIGINDIVLYKYMSRGCSGLKLTNLDGVTNICVDITKNIPSSANVPTIIRSGLRRHNLVEIHNQTGRFNFTNCVFEGTLIHGKIDPANNVSFVEADGTYTTTNGNTITGHIVNNVIVGKGKLELANGKTIEGNFVNGKLEGQGRYSFPDGMIKSGTFENNQLVEGEITMPDHSVKSGKFLYEKLTEGSLTYPDGRIDEGIFIDNELKRGKQITKVSPDSSQVVVAEGYFTNGKLRGIGKIVYPDGKIESGSFQEGKLNGMGNIIYPDGRVEEGRFYDGKLEGKGKIMYPDGRVEEGVFEDGELYNPNTKSKSDPEYDLYNDKKFHKNELYNFTDNKNIDYFIKKY